jgi:hypothetical protein
LAKVMTGMVAPVAGPLAGRFGGSMRTGYQIAIG